ncbi:bile acid-CoA:amino acid N-acyltransferase isoform X2 [Amia ocellicauda]|uniref:bile acid-CoA:amino acid N-acyltransferase isoform X2 n=1 Tax=Amia ocellicauda TaxID=2972642 RepID=UPI003463E148
MRMLSTSRTMRALLVCHRVWEGLIQSIHACTIPRFKKTSCIMGAVRDRSTQSQTPLLTATPSRALVDQPVEIGIWHLPPNKPFTVRSHLRSEDGDLWEAFSYYRSDQKGTVILSRDQSLGGSYSGLEPMGLFWSLQPVGGEGLRFRKKNAETPFTMEVCVLSGHVRSSDSLESRHVEQGLQEGAVLAAVNVERWYMAPGVRRVEVRQQGLVGTLFLPAGPGPFPAVLDMWGMGGGLNEYRSALLASHGFVSLALAYCGHRELTGTLHTVNVGDQYFETAMGLLHRHPQVCTGRVGVLGQCFGGYLALRIAMEMPNVNPRCVVGISAPAGLKINVTREQMNDFMKENHKLWRLNEQGYVIFRGMFLPSNVPPVYKLKVESLRCPLLLIAGEDDQAVAAIESVDEIEERLGAVGRSGLLTRIQYPGTGHLIEPPYTPNARTSLFGTYPKKMISLWGGQLQPHSVAQEDAWKRILGFLDHHLRADYPLKEPEDTPAVIPLIPRQEL